MKRRCKSFAAVLCLCLFFAAIVALQWASPELVAPKRQTRKQDTTHPYNENCVVHVHGLHHGGTGFTREVVYDSLGGNATVSKHMNTGVPEDEGQHLQSVYPLLETRRTNPNEWCGVDPNSTDTSRTTAMCYYCPKLVTSLANNSTNKLKLHEEWSRHWNLSKPFLVQKTPTLDVLFLEKMKLHPTVHVIVMRHPFAWMESFQPTVWLRVWSYILELLSNSTIQSFVVVNYEALVLHRPQVETKVAAFIRQECERQASDSSDTADYDNSVDSSRRLELHEHVENATQYLASPKMVLRYNNCLRNDECKAIMADAEPFLREIGYNWNPEVPFQLPNNDSHLLYTPNRPPPKALVQQMKQLLP